MTEKENPAFLPVSDAAFRLLAVLTGGDEPKRLGWAQKKLDAAFRELRDLGLTDATPLLWGAQIALPTLHLEKRGESCRALPMETQIEAARRGDYDAADAKTSAHSRALHQMLERYRAQLWAESPAHTAHEGFVSMMRRLFITDARKVSDVVRALEGHRRSQWHAERGVSRWGCLLSHDNFEKFLRDGRKGPQRPVQSEAGAAYAAFLADFRVKFPARVAPPFDVWKRGAA